MPEVKQWLSGASEVEWQSAENIRKSFVKNSVEYKDWQTAAEIQNTEFCKKNSTIQ